MNPEQTEDPSKPNINKTTTKKTPINPKRKLTSPNKGENLKKNKSINKTPATNNPITTKQPRQMTRHNRNSAGHNNTPTNTNNTDNTTINSSIERLNKQGAVQITLGGHQSPALRPTTQPTPTSFKDIGSTITNQQPENSSEKQDYINQSSISTTSSHSDSEQNTENMDNNQTNTTQIPAPMVLDTPNQNSIEQCLATLINQMSNQNTKLDNQAQRMNNQMEQTTHDRTTLTNQLDAVNINMTNNMNQNMNHIE